jgi:hypothetical protein
MKSLSKNPFENFDYRIDCDDFLLYELGRLIEEDRASFEDEEFRGIIESGIHEHIERRLDIRANMAARLRAEGAPSTPQLLRAIEDIESPLQEIPLVIQSYTAYLFARLETCAAAGPDERVTTAAELLLDWAGDHATAETAIDVLGSIRSGVSARVLAHVISEPLLDEDLETKAANYVRAMWPLPRFYILHSLKSHTHEDLPFRWFQLLIDCQEPSGVDRMLEEVLVHSKDPAYREDLLALASLLERSQDPGAEDKVLDLINSESLPREAAGVLEVFLRNTELPGRKAMAVDNPWSTLDRIYAANQTYLAASRMFDAGQKTEAKKALEELLKQEPQYPFALMLKEMV